MTTDWCAHTHKAFRIVDGGGAVQTVIRNRFKSETKTALIGRMMMKMQYVCLCVYVCIVYTEYIFYLFVARSSTVESGVCN